MRRSLFIEEPGFLIVLRLMFWGLIWQGCYKSNSTGYALILLVYLWAVPIILIWENRR